jgi:hypothetical protein
MGNANGEFFISAPKPMMEVQNIGPERESILVSLNDINKWIIVFQEKVKCN